MIAAASRARGKRQREEGALLLYERDFFDLRAPV
jgi:hypothetical protein